MQTGDVWDGAFEVGTEIIQAEYLYNNGLTYYFMDLSTYGEIRLDADIIGGSLRYIRDNTNCRLICSDGKLCGIEIPASVVLKVTDTEWGGPDEKNPDTMKYVQVETGAEASVPVSVQKGDLISLNPRTGEFLGMADSC